MKVIRWFFLIVLSLALLFGVYVAGAIIYATVTDFDPPAAEPVEVTGAATAHPDSVFTLMIWNIGYAGLGYDTDFFYDGGTIVTAPKASVERNFRQILSFLQPQDTLDFILLQEVDKLSKRSYRVNQFEEISRLFPAHAAAFALNYRVNFVPIPFTDPMGRVTAGLASWSRFAPIEATRVSLPSSFEWPKSVFFLDRCMLVKRFPLNTGKELVVVNTHKSAYDDGSLKRDEMNFVRNWIISEYSKGNYVIIGGDWNQLPPGITNEDLRKPAQTINYDQMPVDEDFLPEGWFFVFDPAVPTNRNVEAPYEIETTPVTLIDYFLVSPNLEVLDVKGIDLDFQFSDHQPVYLKVKLKHTENL